MKELAEIWNHLDWTVPVRLVLNIIPSLICITLHELSHGWIAYRLGDSTAKDAGCLTLNPLKHIDIMGLLMMVVFQFGWAKPVPVNMSRFKNPKRDMALTALAGPVSNLLIAAVFLFLYGLLYYPLNMNGGTVARYALELICTTSYLSLALAVFNIIPIPPLDGSKVLFSLVSDETYYKLMRYERYGMVLLLLLVSTKVLGQPLSDATEWLFDKFFVIAEWSFRLVTHFV